MGTNNTETMKQELTALRAEVAKAYATRDALPCPCSDEWRAAHKALSELSRRKQTLVDTLAIAEPYGDWATPTDRRMMSMGYIRTR